MVEIPETQEQFPGMAGIQVLIKVRPPAAPLFDGAFAPLRRTHFLVTRQENGRKETRPSRVVAARLPSHLAALRGPAHEASCLGRGSSPSLASPLRASLARVGASAHSNGGFQERLPALVVSMEASRSTGKRSISVFSALPSHRRTNNRRNWLRLRLYTM
jgi:hypothetical protein